MKRSTLIVLLLVSLGFNLGLVASRVLPPREAAAPGVVGEAPERGAARERQRPPLERLVAELELDVDQRRDFERLHRRFLEETRRGRLRLFQLRRELAAELAGPDPDPERLQRSVEEIARLNARLDRALVRTALETRRLLDTEQERRYLELLQRLVLHPAGAPPRRR